MHLEAHTHIVGNPCNILATRYARRNEGRRERERERERDREELCVATSAKRLLLNTTHCTETFGLAVVWVHNRTPHSRRIANLEKLLFLLDNLALSTHPSMFRLTEFKG